MRRLIYAWAFVFALCDFLLSYMQQIILFCITFVSLIFSASELKVGTA